MKRRYPAMVASIAAAMATGWMMLSPGDDPTVSASPAPVVSANISELLSKVTVVDAIPQVPGYERGCGIDKKTKFRESCVFGPAWNDPLDHSGCDTRSRVLAAQLHDVQFKPGTRTCKVTAGWVHDPYTGQRITLEDIAVDHVVALRYAWDAGAWQWTPQQRAIFANDTDNLLAVDTRENSAKGDSGPSEWLPATGQCSYVIRFLSVAAKYQLAIADADRHAAMIACPAGAAS
ncbi:HNH endonuclease family protein [Mycolicibacterium sp. 120270]|uniref:HNH endonuclease family protein n=1 Tax=Mycolicibacterium sp. 120270 TaxID=3090600 RepID=UPI00299D648D|nr:HNH endonuclease family protein [Mycolicibacterium sp. 120270]MDX1886838.1 HNH endonuclease family protein [Mycolicibacterium sp. 120270]